MRHSLERQGAFSLQNREKIKLSAAARTASATNSGRQCLISSRGSVGSGAWVGSGVIEGSHSVSDLRDLGSDHTCRGRLGKGGLTQP